MITAEDRSDLIRIMKSNRLTLSEADTAQMTFTGQIKSNGYETNILILEELPWVTVKQNGAIIYSESAKSIDDLKIFLEERLYRYLEV